MQGMHFDVGHVATLSKTSLLYEAQRIVKEEGFRAFWKGNLVTIAHRLPYSAVNFYTYECYKNVSSDVLFIMYMHFRIWWLCSLSLNQSHSLFFSSSYCILFWGRIIEQRLVVTSLCTLSVVVCQVWQLPRPYILWI